MATPRQDIQKGEQQPEHARKKKKLSKNGTWGVGGT